MLQRSHFLLDRSLGAGAAPGDPLVEVAAHGSPVIVPGHGFVTGAVSVMVTVIVELLQDGVHLQNNRDYSH